MERFHFLWTLSHYSRQLLLTLLLFAGDQNVQDGSASFTGWSDSNYGLGEADEQVLGLLLAESAFDPLLDNIDWGDDSYSGDINLNPD